MSTKDQLRAEYAKLTDPMERAKFRVKNAEGMGLNSK